ncbi:general secretion pathway protein GspK [Alteromonas sp. a30]|uniref:general secretion pathway protein GspK n=1 Tax=Alteromonas sp. a30 TaxID=2730917 RepID=UPI00227F83C0|nr:type II secretion system protein GspK [Alteromonas sp. a30]MCY7294376.1 hypothetical protein [Alteromonas sp. a30]
MRALPQKQSGAALIFSLLVAILLGVFAAFFTHKAQKNIKLAESVSKRIELSHKTESELNKAIYGALNLGFSGLVWPDSGVLYPAQFWGKPEKVSAQTNISLLDLSAMLNVVPFRAHEWRSVLQYYGKEKAEAEAIVDRIEDWMDTDNFRRLQGMEARAYRISGLSIYPRNDIMQSLDELTFIPGMDSTLFAQLKDEMSYWGATSRSPLLGSPAMILAYSSQEQYQEVMRKRAESGQLRVLYNRLEGVDATLVNDVPSGIFRITVEVAFDNAATFRREADVNMAGTDVMPFYINGWQ